MAHTSIMLDLDHGRIIQPQLLPDRIYIRSIEITRAVPSLFASSFVSIRLELPRKKPDD